ncbi:ligand of Numb protein X 2-like [Lytechinus pictus]|uniref:ligand of Numb protein X 2-like n=1 Tax=Lytechinus pictus TaxID=7653 RepID=UPI0030B9DBF7
MTDPSPAARNPIILCRTCGQRHQLHDNHVYDYCDVVDEELTCNICLQPLVNPMDTMCGHTFCMRCLRSVLNLHKFCPIDRRPLTQQDCRSSSLIVRRMLDRLIVLCPNTDFCTAKLPRSELEPHLANRCPGRIVGPGAPIRHGQLTSIEINRKPNRDLGIYFVGGNETPLIGVVIQEVIPGEVVAEDARILPGDQIVQVNSRDLRDVPHSIAREALCAAESPLRLTVYREKQESKAAPFTTKVLQVSLTKVTGVPLGIKIAAKQSEQGIYIMEVLESSLARRDGRLKSDDRVLQINGFNVEDEMPERVARIIRDCGDRVEMVVSRQVQVTTPEVIQGPPAELPTEPFTLLRHALAPKVRAEKTVNIKKGYKECMGISVSGGKGQRKGDVPIFITGIQADGCVARHGQLKKGDILLSVNGTSLLDLPHTEAVKVLKESANARSLTLSVIEGDTDPDNETHGYIPSWLTWLSLPQCCRQSHQITLEKGTNASLGFSIVGGNDSTHGPQPIYVKTVVSNGVAAKNGLLKCGDIIESVNSVSLLDISHKEAVTLLKNIQQRAQLTIVSWPGTII